MAYGDDETDPEKNIKKSLDKFEQRFNAKYGQIMEQVSALAANCENIMSRQDILMSLVRLRSFDNIQINRDICLLSEELELLIKTLAPTNPQIKAVLEALKPPQTGGSING